MGAGEHGVIRRHQADAGIQAALGRLALGAVLLGIEQGDGEEAVAVQEAIECHLLCERGGHGEDLSVVLPAGALGGNSELLLIEEGEDQFAILHGSGGDGVVSASRRAGKIRAFHGGEELPAGDGRAAERQGAAQLQSLHGGRDAGDGVTLHIGVVHGDGDALGRGIDKGQHVLLGLRGKDQLLLCGVRVNLQARILRIRSDKSLIIHGSGLLKHGKNIPVHILHNLVGRYAVVRVLQEVADGIGSLLDLAGVDEGDLIGAELKRDALAAGVRAVARHGDSLLCDLGADAVGGVGDDAVRHELGAVLVHIVDGVAEDGMVPLGEELHILREGLLPVIQVTALGGSVPAVKGVAVADGVCRSVGLCAAVQGLGGRRLAVAAVQVKGNGVLRRNPPSIEGKIRSGHLSELIERGEAGIGIPAAPGVVLGEVGGALRHVVEGSGADIGVELDL